MRRMTGGVPDEQETFQGPAEGQGLWESLTRYAGIEKGGTMPGMSDVTGIGGGGWGAGLAALGAGLGRQSSGAPQNSRSGGLGFGRLMQSQPYRAIEHRRRSANDDLDISRVMSVLGGR